jgi:hypothetical protein
LNEIAPPGQLRRSAAEETSMTSNGQRWLYHGLLTAAMICIVVELIAMARVGAPKWTTSLNLLAVALILLAVTTRRINS